MAHWGHLIARCSELYRAGKDGYKDKNFPYTSENE